MLHIFTIFDVKAHAYLQPFFMPTVAEANRLFSDCINDSSHPFGKHPEDYILFLSGSFDTNKGNFELLQAKNCLGQGVDYLTNKKEHIDLEDNIIVPTIGQ